jgi:hypothetical protein
MLAIEIKWLTTKLNYEFSQQFGLSSRLARLVRNIEKGFR